MNRGLNLPSIQRIMNEFEKESATMDMKEEMMADAVEDVMDNEEEEEEEEGDKILKEVLDEIGVGLQQQVKDCRCMTLLHSFPIYQLGETPNTEFASNLKNSRQAIAVGESESTSGSGSHPVNANVKSSDLQDEDALQARLDALRKP